MQIDAICGPISWRVKFGIKITLRCLIEKIVILLLIIHFTYLIINYIIKKRSFTNKIKVKQIEQKLQEYGKPTVYQGNI